MLPTISNQHALKHKEDFVRLREMQSNRHILAEHEDEVLTLWHVSPFIKRVSISQPAWLAAVFENNSLQLDYYAKNYEQILTPIFSEAGNVADLQRLLRTVRTAEYSRIAWRELQSYASVKQTLYEVSVFAEICINKTIDWCFAWLHEQAKSKDLLPENNLIIFALGKLGGQELNFSSDVDLVFAYADNDKQTQEESAAAIEFYTKLAQLFIKVLAEQTEDSFVYRVDTRLRPFGVSGSLIPSLSAIDLYFQTHGRDWERYAWIKARAIAGDQQAGSSFLQQAKPFIYRRYIDYGAMECLREMKILIAKKAAQNIEKVDVKVGQGGIREIEFIAQVFQLVHGGRDQNLRMHSTLMALRYLGAKELLAHKEISQLMGAYLFLRHVENVIQIREDQQTHILPSDINQQAHFAYMLNYASWEDFYAEYEMHTTNVNNVFTSLFSIEEGDEDKENSVNNEFHQIWQQIEDRDFCCEILSKYVTSNAENYYTHLSAFAQSGHVRNLIPVARQRLDEFMPILLSHILQSSKQESSLLRFINILNKIVQRSTYISLLIENKNKLSSLFKLLEESAWAAQYIATHPLLLDDILGMENLYEPPSLQEMQNQLEVNLQSSSDLEIYMQHLREFKNAQVLQIATADIIEGFPIMRVSDHLSSLAEVCITSALNRAYSDLEKNYGQPVYSVNEKELIPELLVIEYGKLGGLELGYGSDLDIVFLHNGKGEACGTNGAKKIDNDTFFARLVQRTIHLLTTYTAAGKVFEVDLRLRPHGQAGPIISSLRAYEHYFKNDAWLWECQALVRARPISSSSLLSDEFVRLRNEILSQSRDTAEVSASIIEMREKIISAHASSDKDKFKIKKDKGGIVDIEFIAQFFVLAYAHKYPDLCTYTDNMRILDTCSDVGILQRNIADDIEEIYLKYRTRIHQLSLQLLPEVVEASEFVKERELIQNYWSSLLH